MMYTHLLFDLDGTLFDYDRAESEALAGAFAEAGIPYAPAHLSEYRRINQQIWIDYERGEITQRELRTERFARLGSTLGVTLHPESFSLEYLARLSQGRHLLPGVVEVLPALREKRYRMDLITNGISEVQRSRLAGSEITGYFTDIFISGEMEAAKPDPEIFEKSFSRMGNPPRDKVLLIGDSLSSDIAGGAAFGIDTCWINPNGAENDSQYSSTYTLKGVSELCQILTL